MQDSKHSRRTVYWLTAILCAVAIVITFAKVKYLDFSFNDKASFYYQADATLAFEAKKGANVKLSISLPEKTSLYYFGRDPAGDPRFKIIRENGLARAAAEFVCTSNGWQNISYRFKIIPKSGGAENTDFNLPPQNEKYPQVSDEIKLAAAKLVKKIDPEGNMTSRNFAPALFRELAAMPPDQKKMFSQLSGSSGTLEAAYLILSLKKIPARIVRGIFLNEQSRSSQAAQFLEVWCGDSWVMFKPSSGEEQKPKDFLVLQRSGKSLYEISGASNSSLRFSVTKVPQGAASLNRIRADVIGKQKLSDFSLFSLPASEQNVFKRLTLLPLAILFIVIARNIIGIQTMGTFMPVLIAMAFLEMNLVSGLLCFCIILTVGLSIRFWLSKLNLLMVPRISAVVVVVILIMQAISIAGNLLKLPDFMSVTFFPLIIIAWTIERASTIWEEDGAGHTLKQLAASLITAVFSYLVLSNSYLQYLLYTFAELNLAILGIILLLGTYAGYRLTELLRFKSLVNK